MSPRSALPYSSRAKTDMTTGNGASMRLRQSTMRTRARRTRCLQMNRIPSASSAKKCGSSRSPAARGRGTKIDERGRDEEARSVEPQRRRRAERATSTPPIGAPMRSALCWIADGSARALEAGARHVGEVPRARARCTGARRGARRTAARARSRRSQRAAGSRRRRRRSRDRRRRSLPGSRAGRRSRRRRTPPGRSGGS